MKRDEFIKIFEESDGGLLHKLNDCNVFVGLQVIREYIPNAGIEGANHDIIYSVDIDKLIKAGIHRKDAEYLGKINWMIEEDSMACYV